MKLFKNLKPDNGLRMNGLSFRRRENDNVKWIQRTSARAVDQGILGPHQLRIDHLPVAQLRQATDELIDSNGSMSQDDLDQLLGKAIETHPERVIALMATMHRISTKTLVDILRKEIQLHNEPGQDMATSLRLVIEAQLVNPRIIDRTETRWANVLLLLSTDTLKHISYGLESVTELLSAGEPELRVLHGLIHRVWRQSCRKYSCHLEGLLRESRFAEAHESCEWLSRLDQKSDLTIVLDEEFPEWHKWAAWKPSCSRIRCWQTLSVDQRRGLADVLSLEGPDMLTGNGSTLRHSILSLKSPSEIRHRSLIIRIQDDKLCEPSRIFEQLLSLLDNVLTYDSRRFSHFTDMCLKRPVTAEELEFFDAANATGDSSVNLTLLQVLSKSKGLQGVGFVELIPMLNKINESGHKLRGLVAPLVVKDIPRYLDSLQLEFREHVQRNEILEHVGTQLMNRLHRLKDATWLFPKLHTDIKRLLDRLDSPETLKAALNLHDISQKDTSKHRTNLIQILKAYCLVQLTGDSTTNAEDDLFVELLLRTWSQSKNRVHREAALALAQTASIPVSVRHACLTDLQSIPQRLLEAVWNLNNIEQACFRLTCAMVLNPEDEVVRRLNPCWTRLLEALIEGQGAKLLERMCVSLTMKQWFYWHSGLRKIFLTETERPLAPFLQRSAQRWAERLSTSYLRELELIQEATINGPQVQWVLLGHEVNTTGRLLQALTLANKKVPRLVIFGILTKLRADGGNSETISNALCRLSFMSAAGIATSEDLVEAFHESSKQNIIDLLATIQQTSLLPESDLRALKSIEAIFDDLPSGT
jgi:hypothetical protein